MTPTPSPAAAESTPAAAGPPNFCDSCGRELGAWDGGLCGACADDERDARDERQEWWG